MKKIISANLAGQILLGALVLLLSIHTLIIVQVIPATIVWGGRGSADRSNLYQLEIIAMAGTMLITGIVIAKYNAINGRGANRWAIIGIWVVFAYLVLNTLGNFASGGTVEMLVFGSMTIVMAFCALRMGLEK